MAYGGLNWQPMQLPFSAGLFQRTDDRARPQPYLDICRDAQFDELGGLQTRLPYLAMSNSIFGGGTLSNCRRLAVVNNELCVFTDIALYSWNAQLAKWVLRGTHLAAKVDEASRFVTTGDQIDGDRAELNGTIVFAWTEGTQVYAAALDKATGSVLVSPIAVSSATGRPRLVALATKILLFTTDAASHLVVRAIDPAAPGTAIAGAGTNIPASDINLYYDVVRAGTQDLAVGAYRRTTTTAYTAFIITPALSASLSNKARTCDGPIAVATTPDGTQMQIVRGNGTNVQGDLLTTSTLVDVFTAQAIGTITATPVNQIAAAFSSTVSGGNFTANVWWSFLETNGEGNANFATKFNTVTTANAVGAQAIFVQRIGVASRAFDYNGSVYVWLAWAEDSSSNVAGTPLGVRAAVQNTYFLYRNDGLLVAQAAENVAGGYSPSTGHLPGVIGSGGVYVWAGAVRRSIALGGGKVGNATRSVHDITLTFDSNDARRTAQLGATLYISGGMLLQYDGTNIVEVGTLVFPWAIDAQDSGVGGNIAVGTYNWKGTVRWQNAQGETERSTTATGVQLAIAGASHFALIGGWMLFVTRKQGSVKPAAIEFWRTAVAAQADSAYYLITGQDPTVTTGDNPYIPNNPALATGSFTINDNYSDATLTTKEASPENGGFLESIAPPPATIVIATDTRLFLAGVAGDPDRVWYSRERNDGEIVSFHDALTIDVPQAGGAITAIWFQDETLYVSRQSALYAIPGQGLDNLGNGAGFGPARIISLDVGAVGQESVALTPHGTIFESRKGWHLLDRSGTTAQYIGGPISDFDVDTVLAIDVVETQHHVRILTASRSIIWAYPRVDFPGGQWGEWTISDGIDSIIWQGQHVYLTATGPKIQQSTYSALTYGQDVESAWIKLADLQGAGAARKLQPLGEYRSAFLLRMRVAYNYDPTYIDDVVWSPSPTTVGGPLQMMHGPSRPRCQAIKVRLTALAAGSQAQLATASGFGEGPIGTSGTAWAATFAAKTGNNTVIGELGNGVTMAITFESGSPNLVDVRDHAGYDFTFGWGAVLNRVGVRVRCAAGSLTVAALEAAIAASSSLVQLSAADASPTKTINAAAVAGTIFHGAFAGGTFTAPTGEALKLTGLALEVGLEGGLYRRLSAAQKA